MELRDDGDIDTSTLGFNGCAHASKTSAKHNHVMSNHEVPPKMVRGNAARDCRVRATPDNGKHVAADTCGKWRVINPFFARHSPSEEYPRSLQ